MGKRILVAIPIVILVALAAILQGWFLAVFAVALACMCQFEIVRAMDGNGKPVIKTLSFVFTGVMAIAFLLVFHANMHRVSLEHSFVLAVFLLMVVLAFAVVVFYRRHTVESVFNTIFTMVYPQLIFVALYSIILDIRSQLIGQQAYFAILITVLLVFLPAMFSDTFAYFFGRAFGKKKLCPDISPKKTVVGAIAGIVGGIVATMLVWVVFHNWYTISGGVAVPVAPVWQYICIGAVLAVVGQLGDLAASLIKRTLGIKDFGRLLPGHGGVVDRMDSILFCIVALFIIKNLFNFVV